MSHRSASPLSPLAPRGAGLSALLLTALLAGALLLVPAVPASAAAKGKAAAKGAAEEAKKEETWDVNKPPGPSHQVAIDTTEGTWMSVDVSPDGSTVVFDLLGDLYTVPMTGGEAHALTQGMAWDMQPRYSPDGRHIAYTSDAGGGDNVWVMNADGSNPQQVTKESFRLLNSPVWAPDGEFIAARKHFTSTRSLGAGEIWLYHRSGGDGLQMTARPNDQKDLGEPAFSPDGRYLYYSQDVTPGSIFQYNKDSNDEIYAIQRLDRRTGEVIRLTGGPGGAIRPTPSPDGRYLAFVRRVRFQSTLFLRDLTSGLETPIYSHLDRDMQEAWAIHGVYPAMAWTPDSTAMVFWAGGKLHRLAIAGREVTEIPFHVKDQRQVIEALRFPVDVAPEHFPTRMLRWVRVAPAGDKVVYQALGHLYVRDLPEGTPRRLTSQNDHFELYPSFSRDGRWVVYTTWNDEQLGSVRIVSADGGEGRVLTEQPGHYVEPALSPDGQTVVFRKIAGGYVRTATWSQDPGIYRIPAAGGAMERITPDGAAPHFGADSSRVFLLRSASGDKRELISIDLDNREVRSHLISDWATEFRVSPDERWVAFVESFNAYVAPFTRTGKTIEIGPKTQALPLRRVSRDAGEYLQWAGDSHSLYWALGPELFQLGLTQMFSFLDGAPEKLPEPAAHGRNIGFEVTSDVPTGTVALVGGRVITMTGSDGGVIEDGTVVVSGNRIVAVGPRDQVAVPADAFVVDAAGRTVMPGIIDAHWHGAQGSDEIIPQSNWVNYASLAFGVTTLHDPSNDTSTIFAAAEMARAGLITAPRIFSTGTILYGANSPIKAPIDSLDDARTHLRRMQAVGAITVKSYNQPRREQRQQVLTAARELGIMVVPEGGSLLEHNLTMVVDGHTSVEHNVPVANIYEDVLQLWGGTKVSYTPTLVVAYGGLSGEYYWYQHTNVWENERLLTFVPRDIIDPRSRRRLMAPEEEYNHFAAARAAKQLSDRGVLVQVGAHGQREGLAAHWEMWMMVQGGMTPLEALRAATLTPARHLGMDHDLGTLEQGKLADVLVLDANPLEDIRNSETVSYVMANGRLYDAHTMDQIGNHPQPRGHFYFEVEGLNTVCADAGCEGPASATCRH